MSTFADKKPSRFRTRRIVKRGAVLFLFLIAGIVAALSIVLYAATSEPFWRRYVFPEVFGPYWDTALKWEHFDPNFFPPGATLQNVELVEPGANERPLLRVKQLKLTFAYLSRPSKIIVRQADVDGVDANLILYSRDETNLTRIVNRLYQGKNPAVPKSVPTDRDVVPYILLSNMTIPSVNLHISDRRFLPNKLEYDFAATEPVKLDFTDAVESKGLGRLDQFTRITALGAFSAHFNDIAMESRALFVTDVPKLGHYPDTTAKVKVTLRPEGTETGRIDVAMDLPLNRIPVRISATPLTNVTVAARADEKSDPWIQLIDFNMDPLTGDLKGQLEVHGTADHIGSGLRAFVAEKNRDRFDGIVNRYVALQQHAANEKPSRVDASISLSGKAITQYAIVDASEKLPMELDTTGSVSTSNIPLQSLAQFEELLARVQNHEGTHETFVSDLKYNWAIHADQATNTATIRAAMEARPAGSTNDDILFSVTLGDPEDSSKPVQFNPFKAGAWDLRFPTLEELRSNLPTYPVFPSYEQVIAQVLAYVNRGTESMNELGIEKASLRQKLTIRDSTALQALLTPLLGGALGAATGEVELSATRNADGQPSEWSARFHVDDIRLKEINDLIGAEGMFSFVREGDVLTASDVEMKIFRRASDGAQPIEFSIGLPRAGRMGGMGPVTPTYINLATGDAHFELFANTIRREFLEIILRVQTFGLSEQLASPFYQKLLTVLGFKPNDLNAQGQADIYLDGDIGPTMRVSSLIKVRNIPVANFLEASATSTSAASEKIDATLAETMTLDRSTMLLRPEEFSLNLFQPKLAVPFAKLEVVATDDTTLDYNMLRTIALEEADEFAAAKDTKASSLKELAAAVFTRTAKLRQAVRGEGGKVVFTIPELNLAQWRTALQESGIPLEGGIVKLQLAAELASANSDLSRTSADGGFTATNLKFAGLDRVIPDTHGIFEIVSANDKLEVRNFESFISLNPDYPSTRVHLTGSADVASFASHWNLEIEQVTAEVLDTLQSSRSSALGAATSFWSRLPSGMLARIAGPRGRIDLAFEGQTSNDGSLATIDGFQKGSEIAFLPDIFNPLSFSASQKATFVRGKAFTIEKMDGEITELGTSSPLLNFSLSDPVIIAGEDSAPDESKVTIRARKSLTDISERLSHFPLPFLNKIITSGLIDGEVVIRIPKTFKSGDQENISDFHLNVSGVTLEGFPKQIDSTVSGQLRSKKDEMNLVGTTFETRVGGESSGRIALSSHYDVANSTLQSTVDGIDLNSRLLEALPPDMAMWARQPATRLNFHGDFDAGFGNNRGRAQVEARVRDFGLPPVLMRDGSTYQHPPLNLDLGLTSAFDRETSTLLLQDFNITLAKGNYTGTARMDSLPEDVPTLLKISQLGPIFFDAKTKSFSANTLVGSGMAARVGPIDLSEYGVVLRDLAGLPLSRGILEGSAAVLSGGIGVGRIETARADIKLRDAAWEKPDGKLMPLEGDLVLTGGHRRGAIRLDSGSISLRYPEDMERPEDELSARGFYTAATESYPRRFELDLASSGISIDRMIEFFADSQRIRESRIAGAAKEKSAVVDNLDSARYDLSTIMPRNLNAVVTGQFDNLNYKEIDLPDTYFKGLYDEGRITLESLRSQVSEGEITANGTINLGESDPSWSYQLSAQNVQARTWVNSLAATKYYNKISGKLGAKVSAQGTGIVGDKLRDSFNGSAIVKLRDGLFEDPKLAKIIGDESDIGADVTVVAKNNRALIRVDTPWNKSRDLLFQGSLRPLVPDENGTRRLQGVFEATRMTAVGPRGRDMMYKGELMPFRQPIAGVLVEVDGPIGRKQSPNIRLRSVNY